jgi:histone H1/5
MPPKEPPIHPKYEDMVRDAITSLKSKKGLSIPAIAKFLAANYTLPDNFKKILSTQLKNLVKSEKLVKVKGSYKLGDKALLVGGLYIVFKSNAVESLRPIA